MISDETREALRKELVRLTKPFLTSYPQSEMAGEMTAAAVEINGSLMVPVVFTMLKDLTELQFHTRLKMQALLTFIGEGQLIEEVLGTGTSDAARAFIDKLDIQEGEE